MLKFGKDSDNSVTLGNRIMRLSDFSGWSRKPIFVMMATGLLAFVIIVLVSYQDIRYTHGVTTLQQPPPGLSQPLPTPSQTSDKKHVLLITYGRSGSSFTSALISRHPDVFYTFEPLYILQKGKPTPQIYRPSDGQKSGLPQLPSEALDDYVGKLELQEALTTDYKAGEVKVAAMRAVIREDVLKEALQIMRAYFTCKFSMTQLYALDNSHHILSNATKGFYTCLRSKRNGMYHLSCYVKFLESCENHKTTFIKTIRFRVDWAEQLLEEYPNLKVLYLMRDPRAVLYSQARVFANFAWQNESVKASRTHCGLIDRDLTSAKSLRTKYPNRIMGIRYEEGATNPFEYTKKIYNFLGLDFNQEVIYYIQGITNSKRAVQKNAYSLVKQNSTKAMNKWRYSAGYNIIHKIDEVCKRLYDSIGYKVVKSQKHLESGESLVQTPKPGGIFD